MHHHVAGVPLDLLMPEFWVPGMMSRQECSKFMGKPLWQQILQVSGEVSVLWLTRLTKEPMVFHESSYMGPLQCQIINKFFCYKDPIISTSRYMLANTHTTALWQDFEKKIQRESTNKAKDLGGTLSCVYFQPLASPPTHCFYIMVYPLASLVFFQTIPIAPKKSAQLDEEQSVLLFDICCVWIWLRRHMVNEFTGNVVDQHDGLFMKGNFWLQMEHVDIYLCLKMRCLFFGFKMATLSRKVDTSF